MVVEHDNAAHHTEDETEEEDEIVVQELFIQLRERLFLTSIFLQWPPPCRPGRAGREGLSLHRKEAAIQLTSYQVAFCGGRLHGDFLASSTMSAYCLFISTRRDAGGGHSASYYLAAITVFFTSPRLSSTSTWPGEMTP